jgi:small GTP-binding protein
MDLREYDRIKFELSAILRAISQRTAQRNGQRPQPLQELFARLAEDRFNLAMVGRFSRGKTSLLNALLGTDRLPTGVVPLTSVITRVTYGSEAKVVLNYYGTTLFMDIPLDQLADYITERGNPGNRRGISIADVQLPAELLRRGFTFVDTPGLGSSIAANTRTTEAFLPDADALILVSSHDSPLSGEELALVDQARARTRRVFLVLNKQDIVDAAGREQSLAHVHAELARVGVAAAVVVFSVSARDALAAKVAGDAALLAASGLPALEAALVDFLVNGQRHAFLVSVCERIALLLRDPGPAELAPKLAELRARVETTGAQPVKPATPELPPLSPLLPACEVCAQLAQAMFNFFANYQLQLYGSSRLQAELAAHGGFCRLHARQFEAIAAGREVAIGLAPVLAQQASRLRHIAATGPSPARSAELIADLLPTGDSCPACATARTIEAREIGRLAALVANQGPGVVHRRSALCIPHLARLVAAVRDPGHVQALVLRQAELLDRLEEDARRFALKYDAVRRYDASQEEFAVAGRAPRVLLEHPSAQCEPGTADAATSGVGPGVLAKS